MPRTLRTIAQRLRGAFFLVQVAAGANLVWQRDSPPALVLASLATLYALLYSIPSLLGWAVPRLRLRRRRLSRRRVRRVLAAVRRHVLGEPWERPSLRFQLAWVAVFLVLALVLLPYALGSVSPLIDQRYPALGPVTGQGDAQVLLAVYGDKAFVADPRQGKAQAVRVENLGDVNHVEIHDAQFAGLAWDLCQHEPDPLDRWACYVLGAM